MLLTLNVFAMIGLLIYAALLLRWNADWKNGAARWLHSVYRWTVLPLQIRFYFGLAWLKLKPICGAAGQNGATVMLKVNVEASAGSDYSFVGGQANLTINETTAEIDVSDKLSGRLGERVPGRATASVSLDVNFLRSDSTIQFLKSKYRNRENVTLLVFDRDSLAAGAVTGTGIETATGIIVNFTETHPDQDKSTVSLEVNLNNDWVPA